MIEMTPKLQKIMDELKRSSSETYYHSINVKNLTVKMIKLMNEDGFTSYTSDQMAYICKGALLHDVGKLNVDNAVLTKAAPLTSDEREHIMAHTKYSYKAVKDELTKDEKEFIKNICLYHHERIDGSGYEGLKELPVYVQVVSVCDAFAALYFDRIYRNALDYSEAMRMIENGESGCFDKGIVGYLKRATVDLKD